MTNIHPGNNENNEITAGISSNAVVNKTKKTNQKIKSGLSTNHNQTSMLSFITKGIKRKEKTQLTPQWAKKLNLMEKK